MLSKLQKTVARNAFRQASRIQQMGKCLWLQTPPSPDEFQQYSLLSSTEEALVQVYPSELASLINTFPTRMIDGPTLRKIVHAAFRLSLTSPDDVALESLRCLNSQMMLSKTTSIETTECLRIVVTSLYDVDREIDATGQHIFFYRVLFENTSDTDVVQLVCIHHIARLLSLCWVCQYSSLILTPYYLYMLSCVNDRWVGIGNSVVKIE